MVVCGIIAFRTKRIKNVQRKEKRNVCTACVFDDLIRRSGLNILHSNLAFAALASPGVNGLGQDRLVHQEAVQATTSISATGIVRITYWYRFIQLRLSSQFACAKTSSPWITTARMRSAKHSPRSKRPVPRIVSLSYK